MKTTSASTEATIALQSEMENSPQIRAMTIRKTAVKTELSRQSLQPTEWQWGQAKDTTNSVQLFKHPQQRKLKQSTSSHCEKHSLRLLMQQHHHQWLLMAVVMLTFFTVIIEGITEELSPGMLQVMFGR
uniref:Uncharacterized protein n=1 Tax=Stomoxys calcitrans TaxID=35570 RepID=A0A1I8PFL4_STOCA